MNCKRLRRLVLLAGSVLFTLNGALASAPQPQSPPPQHQPPAQADEEKSSEEEAEQTPQRSFVVTVEESYPVIAQRGHVATKLSTDLHNVPVSVSVVSHPLFKSQDGVVLSDALRNVSGVNIQTNFGVHDLFYIRGFESLQGGLVLTDGAAEPEATYYHLYNIDQIEVLKGPGAFLYGGNPLSGAINLSRKSPQPSTFFQASGTMGSFQTFRGQLDYNLGSTDSPVAFRLNLMGQDSAGYRDGRDNHQVAVNPSLSWNISSQSNLSLNFEFVTNEYTPDAGIPLLGQQIAPVPRERSYGSPFDISDQQIVRVRADWTTRFNENVALRNKFYYTDLDWTSSGTLLNGVFPNRLGGLDVQRILSRLDDRQRLAGNQIEGVFSFHTGAVEHQLLAGFEISRLGDDFDLRIALLPPLDLFQPVETAREPLFFLPGQEQLGETRSLALAPYVVDQISFGERVGIFLGGRWDHVDFEDRLSGADSSNNQFSPMAGISLMPDPAVTLYANYGRAFSPPSSLVVGDRQPEESTQYEVGFKSRLWKDRLNGSLAVFRLDRRNIPIPDENGITRRQGDQVSRGVEIELAAQHSPFWHTFFSYAYTDPELTRFTETAIVNFFPLTFATVDRSGNRPPFAPQHILNVWTQKDFRGGFGLGGGARYLDRQFIAADNAFAIDRYVVLDAVISYRLENWRLSLNLKNLTDEQYETRGFGTASVIPGDGFGVFGTIQFTR